MSEQVIQSMLAKLTPEEKEVIWQLVRENKKYKADTKKIIELVQNIMRVLGLIDNTTGKIRAEIISGEEKVLPVILKSLMDLVSKMMQAKMPGGIGRRAEEDIEQRFSFVKEVIPIVQEYAGKY